MLSLPRDEIPGSIYNEHVRTVHSSNQRRASALLVNRFLQSDRGGKDLDLR